MSGHRDLGMVVFPDEAEAFARGFELGVLWLRLETGREASIVAMTRFANRQALLTMAIAEGWGVRIEATDRDGWDRTRLRWSRPPAAPGDSFGLGVLH